MKKIHDLETILNLCARVDREFLELDKEEIARLSLYAVEVRYPDESFEVSLDESKRHFEIAGEVRDFVRKKLKEKGWPTHK
ncbi:MAG: HEPN domain-containing protein [Methanobacteriota archaeon]|nr:MAG: HEPN domain-containing protein [Euryarchaeota archaeon]